MFKKHENSKNNESDEKAKASSSGFEMGPGDLWVKRQGEAYRKLYSNSENYIEENVEDDYMPNKDRYFVKLGKLWIKSAPPFKPPYFGERELTLTPEPERQFEREEVAELWADYPVEVYKISIQELSFSECKKLQGGDAYKQPAKKHKQKHGGFVFYGPKGYPGPSNIHQDKEQQK